VFVISISFPTVVTFPDSLPASLKVIYLVCSKFGLYLFRNRELVTTEIELVAIAIAANIGSSLNSLIG